MLTSAGPLLHMARYYIRAFANRFDTVIFHSGGDSSNWYHAITERKYAAICGFILQNKSRINMSLTSWRTFAISSILQDLIKAFSCLCRPQFRWIALWSSRVNSVIFSNFYILYKHVTFGIREDLIPSFGNTNFGDGRQRFDSYYLTSEVYDQFQRLLIFNAMSDDNFKFEQRCTEMKKNLWTRYLVCEFLQSGSRKFIQT